VGKQSIGMISFHILRERQFMTGLLDYQAPHRREARSRPAPEPRVLVYTQTKILPEPEDRPWKLRGSTAADLEGNLIRVCYDFRRLVYGNDKGGVAKVCP
jgi:hypothetical protein